MSATPELEREITLLRTRVAELEQELGFLRTHGTLQQGMRGETLLATVTPATLTVLSSVPGFAAPLAVDSTIIVEMKFSKLNTPVAGSATRRWNWSKPLGWKDKGKRYDLLVLVGEKDPRYPEQYVDDAPYVFFVVPYDRVPEIMTHGRTIGANVQITSNLAKALSSASIALKQFVVPAASVNTLLDGAQPA